MLNAVTGTKLNPNIYSVHTEGRDKYYLLPKLLFYKVPNKIYGESNRIVDRVWNKYKKSTENVSVMLTGTQGSGKTLIANLIANKAIRDGMPVIEVTNVTTSIELIKLMDSLENCVIILDEFGKLFNMSLQEKALSMFSNVNTGKKIFIITENSKDIVSRFIRNRPGRVFYSFDFDRISDDALIEYCRDYNVSEQFIKDVRKLHKKSSVFTIDFIKALVSEHLDYPNDTVEDLLNVLNLDVLSKPSYLRISSVVSKNEKTSYDIIRVSNPNLKKEEFLTRGYKIYISVVPVKTDEEKEKHKNMHQGPFGGPDMSISINIDAASIIDITEDSISCETTNMISQKEYTFIVKLNIVDS